MGTGFSDQAMRQTKLASPHNETGRPLGRPARARYRENLLLLRRRQRRLGVRRERRVGLGPAQLRQRLVERLVVLRLRRNVGLRAGILLAFLGLEVTAQ